ncbi:LysR family transcriptional regulator [Lactobacillus sp. CBA3606]|uniref:LysR family transcriptional regulator n=1 Tax=Lactobacillus sp. CBA3606 TaxID=2099789 RepID=UPI000CFC75BA|nr:LysR family transcriptional regulator [Lactobacillus sp. CBA3606]AVK64259.1 LysR family transcriptional regulator [Lactobacillus sp. CBA3606]
MIENYLLEELTVFAQTGTLTQTAAQLNVTQPSVTRGMQKLEDDFGVQLFVRQANRIKLTPTGELAAKEATKLLQASTAMVSRVQNYYHGQHTTILAATVPGPLILLTQLQNTLNEKIQLVDKLVPTESIETVLTSNQYSILFSNQEIFATDIESQYIGEERLQVNLDQFMYLANQATVTFDELKGLSFIVMRAIGSWHKIIEKQIANAKFMYQDDRDSFTEITKYSRFPFFTTSLSQSDPLYDKSVKADTDRVSVPISDDSAQMPIYANYSLSQKSRLIPLIRDIQQHWPTAIPK